MKLQLSPNDEKLLWIAGGILGGLVGILLIQPPAGPCDEQVALYISSHKQYMTRGEKGQRPFTARLIDACRADPTTGGCAAYLEAVDQLLREWEEFPSECHIPFAENSTLPVILGQATELLGEIGWGEDSNNRLIHGRYSWLEPSEVRLYCRARRALEQMLGEEAMGEKIKNYGQKLLKREGQAPMSEDQQRERSLHFVACKKILSK